MKGVCFVSISLFFRLFHIHTRCKLLLCIVFTFQPPFQIASHSTIRGTKEIINLCAKRTNTFTIGCTRLSVIWRNMIIATGQFIAENIAAWLRWRLTMRNYWSAYDVNLESRLNTKGNSKTGRYCIITLVSDQRMFRDVRNHGWSRFKSPLQATSFQCTVRCPYDLSRPNTTRQVNVKQKKWSLNDNGLRQLQ